MVIICLKYNRERADKKIWTQKSSATSVTLTDSLSGILDCCPAYKKVMILFAAMSRNHACFVPAFNIEEDGLFPAGLNSLKT